MSKQPNALAPPVPGRFHIAYLLTWGVGRTILSRHRALRSFLEDILEIDPQTANAEACKIEHCISQETMDRWSAWMETCRACKHRTEQ